MFGVVGQEWAIHPHISIRRDGGAPSTESAVNETDAQSG